MPSHDERRARHGLHRSIEFHDHGEGLSGRFRQWRADRTQGSLSPVRRWLHDMFGHTLIVAEDGSERAALEFMAAAGLVDVRWRSAARPWRISLTFA